MSYVTAYYHIVFSTHCREAVLTSTYGKNLHSVIASIIKKKGCKALIVNGVENHIHALINLNPNIALADLMRDIKSQSSLWAKNSGLFPMFKGWGEEYGAFSLSASHRQAVYEYVANQEAHHKDKKLEEEFERLVLKNGLVFYEW